MGSRLFQSVVMPLMRVRAAARGIERLHEDWLVLMCCDMVHASLSLERLLVESSDCIGTAGVSARHLSLYTSAMLHSR